MGRKKNNQSNNFQDEAEVKEYDKGKRAGQVQANSRSRNGRKQSSRRGANKKPNFSKPRSGGRKFEATGSSPVTTGAKMDNDPNWYIISDTITKDVANLTQEIMMGIPITRDPRPRPSDKTNLLNSHEPMPGISTLFFAPTFGSTQTGPNSPLNMAANALYTFIAKDQLGYTKASACDFMIYTLALDSAYYMYAWACRLVGIVNYGYSASDMYTPRALIEAQGVNYTDLVSNLPQFRAQLNEFAFNLQALKVPAGMTYNARHVWMCENIYTDAPSKRAQYYMYVPAGYWVYSETNLSATGPFTNNLTFNWLPTSSAAYESVLTTKQIISHLNKILAPIWGSQDCKRMSSQVLKAFGNQTVPINPIAESYVVTPSYSQEVLMQIENAYIWCHHNNSIKNDPDLSGFEGTLTQHVNDLNVGEYLEASYKVRTNCLYQEGILPQTEYEGLKDNIGVQQCYSRILSNNTVLLNYHKDEVTVNDYLVSTRLSKCPCKVTNVSQGTGNKASIYGKLDILEPGSEIIISAELSYMYRPTGFVVALERRWYESLMQPYQMTRHMYDRFLATLEKFDWHPIVQTYAIEYPGVSNGANLYEPIGHFDLDTITLTHTENIGKINNAIMLKMFQPTGMAGVGIRG